MQPFVRRLRSYLRCGLYGAEIDTDYLGLWMQIGILDSPGSISRAKIEDAVGSISFRAKAQLPTKREDPRIVLDIQALELGVVVRIGIL